jgi:hypothetical protein
MGLRATAHNSLVIKALRNNKIILAWLRIMVYFVSSMNTQHPRVQRALKKARALQRDYTAIGTRGTQNVRNPIPLHEAAAQCLPVLPADGKIVVQKRVTFAFMGSKVTQNVAFPIDAEKFFGENYLPNDAMTVDELVDVMRANGFLVNNPRAIYSAIRNIPGIRSVPMPVGVRKGMRGKVPRGYFIADNTVHRVH